MAFREIKPEELPGNVFEEISKKWLLLTSGTKEDFNFMTVSWGMMGEMWFNPAVTVYVRDSRHTLRYMDKYKTFTLTSLKPGNQEALMTAGTKSGRDVDKVKETGLTPVQVGGGVSFEEAAYTIVCETMYKDKLDENKLLDSDAKARTYPEPKDAHEMYIGKIVRVYVND